MDPRDIKRRERLQLVGDRVVKNALDALTVRVVVLIVQGSPRIKRVRGCAGQDESTDVAE
jgi:hypothetical protein